MAEAKVTTIIAADTHIKGEMTFEQSARIHGKFEGKITAKGELQVSDNAVCAAEVEAENVIVDGVVEGNVRAVQRIQLNANAHMKGDIVAERLVAVEGASIHGHVAVGPEARKRVPEGAPQRAAQQPQPQVAHAAAGHAQQTVKAR